MKSAVEKTNLLKISSAHIKSVFLWFGLIALIQIGFWYLDLWHPFVLSSFLLIGFVWISFPKGNSDLKSKTNRKMISRLINSKFNRVSYHPNSHIYKKCFYQSELYDFSSFIIKGNNLLKGEDWFVSNIIVSIARSKNTESLTVFDGIFTKIKIQKPMEGRIVIKPLPVKDKRLIPEVLQHLIHRYYTPNLNSRKTGNTSFDEKFEVFASSIITQKTLISNIDIKSIIDIDETINYYFGKEYNGMELSYNNDNLYIGIKGIKLFGTNDSLEFYDVQKYMQIIELITKINKQ